MQEQVDLGGEQEEDSLTEQLSAERLEELYAKSGIPDWDPSIEEELKKGDQRLGIDVPIHINRQVKAYLVYFSTERKNIIRKYLARSTRYLPMIREIFQEHGLPEDLAYLAMIESGFNPHAYSHAAACGMWQFIRGTGLRYGLDIDNYVDERRDPEKSTHAAAKYLLDLYKQFGSWYLAAASYNCGEGRVQRELDNSNHKNFWELAGNQCLPNETQNYVPQMIAATLIAKNPEKFGFKGVPYLPPLQYDKVRVDETTSLVAAAVACKVSLEDIEILNPELRRGITPPGLGFYTLKVPKGTADAFARNIMVARIEHPAVVKSYQQTARKTYQRSNGRKYAVSKAGKRRNAVSKNTGTSAGKAAIAKAPPKKAAAVQIASVKKSNATRQPVASRQSGAAPVMASVLASPHNGKSKSMAKNTGKSAGKTAVKAGPSKAGKKKVSSATSKPGNGTARAAGKPAKNSTGTMLISKR